MNFFHKIFGNVARFFGGAQAVEEALRKDRDCPAEKETPKKEKVGGKRPRRFAAQNVAEFCQILTKFSRNFVE